MKINQIIELDLEASELKYEQNQTHQINLSLKNLLKNLEDKEKRLLVIEDEQKKNLMVTDPENFIFLKKTLSLPTNNTLFQKYGLQKSSKNQYDFFGQRPSVFRFAGDFGEGFRSRTSHF